MGADAREPSSRRAFLAAALGGLTGVVAAALGHPQPADAAAGSPLILGSQKNNAGTADTQLITNSGVVALKALQYGTGTALMGHANRTSGNTRGVYGRSDSGGGDGVQARNAGPEGSGVAVRAIGGNNHGIHATTMNMKRAAIWAEHSNWGAGLHAYSLQGVAVVATSPLGEALRATTSDGGYAVFARCGGEGIAVHGESTEGWAGRFVGPVRCTRHVDIAEMETPIAPGAGTGRLFVRDNGSGKSQLCVLFGSGAVQVLATQP